MKVLAADPLSPGSYEVGSAWIKFVFLGYIKT